MKYQQFTQINFTAKMAIDKDYSNHIMIKIILVNNTNTGQQSIRLVVINR